MPKVKVKAAKGVPYTAEKVFKIYDLFASGLAHSNVAAAVGVCPGTLTKWAEKYPPVGAAVRLGTAKAGAGAGFFEYIYNSMDAKTKAVWDELDDIDKNMLPDRHRAGDRVFQKYGTGMRQMIFLHALVACDFDRSEACRKARISKDVLYNWLQNDQFRKLMNEMRWHRNNFFEAALFRKVKDGDTAAVIFANKTQNKGRGYSEKVEHTHDVNVSVTAKAVGLDEILDVLDVPTRKKILEAMAVVRGRQDARLRGEAVPALPAHGVDADEIMDAEFAEVEGGDK